jgi:hypothetical protein
VKDITRVEDVGGAEETHGPSTRELGTALKKYFLFRGSRHGYWLYKLGFLVVFLIPSKEAPGHLKLRHDRFLPHPSKYYATNRKVAGSIPDEVIGFFN